MMHPANGCMAEKEVSYLPAKEPPLRLCLSKLGLPFAIIQVTSNTSSTPLEKCAIY